MKKKFLIFMFFMFMPVHLSSESGLDTLKGIGTGIANFGEKFAGFFKMMGGSFGAPPTGYVYSFDVYNDLSSQTMYVAVNEILSFMGGDLPKPHGWSIASVLPGQNHLVNDQDFYFEMFIKATDAKYSSCMPYLPHEDMLYRQDCTALTGLPHSQQLNYFRIFMGKTLKNGVYVHAPQAESLGYFNQNPADAKTDPGSVTTGTTLTSLTIVNNTSTDYYVGFVNQASAASMTQATCLAYGLVQAYSFGLLSTFGSVASLTPGTIGIFDASSNQLVKSYNMPINIFQTMPPNQQPLPYTLEIYQDVSSTGSVLPVSMEMQGIMSGNYDQPIGVVRDITPVTCVFWYQSNSQLGTSGYHDLKPGKVWVVSVELSSHESAQTVTPVVITSATPGQALQFNLKRPHFGNKLWLYFLYVATSTDATAQQYITNFFSQSAGKTMLQTYQAQGASQIKLASQPSVASATQKSQIPATILVQAAQGVLPLNGGAVVDPGTGLTGYLLGADVFLSSGVGAGPMYYQLQP
ncbi:hypothetical protein A3J41_03490 [candidate division TM6 bacterium RIFCSPHIGHO2_12_FULL_38_8]|nr:MAG: hypothetical protein A3J41_03490 [candidate division TM6 bacterium RIFCSPHIGHO2_12_FULL_38_8]